uniref:Polyprotein n=1 Tax=Bat pegivirus TaxID=1112699 RepID=N0A103_9FLAV|nr:polyprotein [Bat pegivirus]
MALLLLLLFSAPLVGGWVPSAASHACRDGDSYFLSNCCNPDEVEYCFPTGCFTSEGCTICTNGTCWITSRPGFSHPPGVREEALPAAFRSVFVTASWGAYGASILGLGEPYAVALLVLAGTTLGGGRPPPLQCNVSCTLTWHDGNWQLGQAVSSFSVPLEKVLELPARIVVGLWAAGVGMVFLIFCLLCEQRLFLAILLLCATGFAMAAPQPQPTRQCGARFPGFDECDCTGRGFTRSNNTQVCICPFGSLVWQGREARQKLSWAQGVRPGLCCPRYTVTACRVTCRWGSVVWADGATRERLVDLWMLRPNGSAVCSFYHPDTSRELYSCVLDRRPKDCGRCMRDCWDKDADPRHTFERCGVGSQLTTFLSAIPANLVDPVKNQPWIGKAPQNPGVSGPVVDAEVHFTEIGGWQHAFLCPGRPHPVLDAVVPGRPTNACQAFSDVIWEPFGLSAALLRACLPSVIGGRGVYSTCDGFAWRLGRTGDGLIHSLGGWQEIDTEKWWPDPWWWFFDWFVVLIFLMKLGGAKVVPAVFFALYYQGNYMAAGVALPENWRQWVESTVPSGVQTMVSSWEGGSPVNGTLLQGCKYLNCDKWAYGAYYADGLIHKAVGGLFKASDGIITGVNYLQDKMCGLARTPLCPSTIAPTTVSTTTSAGAKRRKRDMPVLPKPSPAPEPPMERLMQLLVSLFEVLRSMNVTLPTLPPVHAAVHPVLVAAPLVSWSVHSEYWESVVLGCLCTFIYLRWGGVARLSALVALKLSKGFVGVLVLGSILHGGRHSALGLRLCVDVFLDEPWDWHPISMLLAFLLAWCFISFSLLTVVGKRFRIQLYGYWAWLYSRLIRDLQTSPIGVYSRHRWQWWWVLAGVFYPDTVCLVSVFFIGCAAALDVFDALLEAMFISQVDVPRLARWCDRWATLISSERLGRVLSRCGANGVWLYSHMGQVSRNLAERLTELGGALEPACVHRIDLERVRDDSFTLACGTSVRGKPVVARRGEEVLIGSVRGLEDLPPGYTLTAPVVVRATGRGFFGVLTTSMLGRDGECHDGNVMVLGTATTRSMGTCLGGVMYTTFHSSNARPLASPTGPLNPRWWSTSDDTVVYPLPTGAQSLEPCGCRPSSAWVVRNDGALCHGQLLQSSVRLDVSLRVSEFEGSSGSPILCDNGHALGMLVSVRHRGHTVHEAVFTVPWNVMPREVTQQMEPPPCPTTGFEEKPLFVPTGSGKSTKIPWGYAQRGLNTLVVNPSIATTLAMGPYMKKLTGTEPSVYAGHGETAFSRTTDSKLTYCTYGRAIASLDRLLAWADVVVCDEAHSLDATTVLGIGLIRQRAEKAGVKLLLYATATPAGAPVTAHPSIREVQLSGEGEIDFYGFRLTAKNYYKGRHLIFAHSKEQCRQLAQEFTRRGCRAMYYYRGCDPQAIPDEGDLVVVATDALMSGYTGNFDTVTDCGVSVTEEVTVTLDPTITIALRVGPSPADTRMQRRGRCGRGREGTYFYTQEAAAPSGAVPSGAVWGAIETAITWYHLQPPVAAEALRVYGACPYTAHVPSTVADATTFIEGLVPFVRDPEVIRSRDRGVNWPLLVGVQRRMCKEGDAMPPNSDPAWAGCTGGNPCPLLVRWGHTAPDKMAPHHITQDLVTRLGVAVGEVDTYVAPVLLVGLGVAAACAIAGATGTLVVVTHWACKGGGTPVALATLKHSGITGYDPTPVPPLGAEGKVKKTTKLPGKHPDGESAPADVKKTKEPLDDVVTKVGWDALASVWTALVNTGQKMSTVVADRYSQWAASGGGVAAIPEGVIDTVPFGRSGFMQAWTKIVGHLTELSTLGVAMWTAGRNPPLAIASSLVLGIQMSLPLEARVACGLLVGALGGSLGTPAVGAGMAAAYVVGGGVRRMPVLGYILDILCGWEATATCASFVFDALNGDAKIADAWYCLAALGSPGAGVAGAAIGALLHFAFSSGTNEKWLNRLLTMLPKGSALPEDYFEHTNMREKASRLLKNMSIARAVGRLLEHQDGVTQCGSSLITDFITSVRRFISWMVNWCKDRVAFCEAPLVTCQRGYTGPWEGDGEVVTRCGCGCDIIATVRGGHVFHVTYSKLLCTNRFRRGIPINVDTRIAGPIPKPGDGEVIYSTGLLQWVRVQKRGLVASITGSTQRCISTRELRVAANQRPAYVNGESVDVVNGREPPRFIYRSGHRLTVDGDTVTLPHPVALTAEYQDVKREEVEAEGCSDPPTPSEPEERPLLPPGINMERSKDGTTVTFWTDDESWFDVLTSGDTRPLTDDQIRAAMENKWPKTPDTSSMPGLETISLTVPSVGAVPSDTPEPEAVYCDVTESITPEPSLIPLPTDSVASLAASVASSVYGSTVAATTVVTEAIVHTAAAAAGAGSRLFSVRKGKKKRGSGSSSPEPKEMRIVKEPEPVPGRMVKIHLDMSCCDRSSRRCVDGILSVKDSIDLTGWDWSGHIPYGETGSRLDLATKLSDLGDCTIRLSCAQETKCGKSYLWSGASFACGLSKPPPISRPIGTLVGVDASRAYITDMRDVALRVEKVTRDRTPLEPDSFFRDAYNCARAAAARVHPNPGFSYEEAVRRVRPGAAPGHNVKLSVADLKTPYGEETVRNCLASIREGKDEHPFMLTAKQEVFYQDKKTRKPPRLICYPSLEFRVAEKMILGDPSRVAKSIMGKAYGFQYTPVQRVEVLRKMWASKVRPGCITVDAICFDSTITPEDVDRETELYALASPDPLMVRRLGKYYAGGPMINRNGVTVGMRACRASGVLTTSSSNSITCYLKVRAACNKVGLRGVDLLIHGDDTLIIYEREDEDPCDRLKAALASYGYPCEPKLHASLDTAESCSAKLAECKAWDRKGGHRHWFLTTDFRRVLARASAEYGDPVASACGYALLYPQHPITRNLLIPQVVLGAFHRGGSPRDLVTCEVAGNKLTFPLRSLPAILVGIHGPDCLRVISDSNSVLVETNTALQSFGMRGLSWHRRKTAALRVAMLRRGGEWAALARALLWSPGLKESPPDISSRAVDIGTVFSEPYQNQEYFISEPERRLKLPRWSALALWVVVVFCVGFL